MPRGLWGASELPTGVPMTVRVRFARRPPTWSWRERRPLAAAGTVATTAPFGSDASVAGAQPVMATPPWIRGGPPSPLEPRQVTEWAALSGVCAAVSRSPPAGTLCGPGASSTATSRLPSASAAATASAAASSVGRLSVVSPWGSTRISSGGAAAAEPESSTSSAVSMPMAHPLG